MKKPPNFVKCLEFFLTCKMILKGNKSGFLQMMYCIAVIDC